MVLLTGLGIIITVATSCLFAAWPGPYVHVGKQLADAPTPLPGFVAAPYRTRHEFTNEETSFGQTTTSWGGSAAYWVLLRGDVGWPVRAMRWYHGNDAPQLELGLQRSGLTIRASPVLVIIPLLPVWPGFAINVLFWMAICLLARLLFRAAIRGRRRRRGLCPGCTYPIKGMSACPECGRAHGETPAKHSVT